MFVWQSSLLHSNASQIEAWTTTHALLQSPDVPVEAKLFAATTLKGKVIPRALTDHRFLRSNLLDCVRLGPTTPRLRTRASRFRPQFTRCFRLGPASHSDSAMCVLGKFGDSDDRMEGRFGHRRLGIGQQCGGLCAGVFEDLAGRSH